MRIQSGVTLDTTKMRQSLSPQSLSSSQSRLHLTTPTCRASALDLHVIFITLYTNAILQMGNWGPHLAGKQALHPAGVSIKAHILTYFIKLTLIIMILVYSLAIVA